MNYYQGFVDKFPSSKYLKQAEKMFESSQKEIDRLTKLEEERAKEKQLQKQQPADRPGKVTAARQ